MHTRAATSPNGRAACARGLQVQHGARPDGQLGKRSLIVEHGEALVEDVPREHEALHDPRDGELGLDPVLDESDRVEHLHVERLCASAGGDADLEPVGPRARALLRDLRQLLPQRRPQRGSQLRVSVRMSADVGRPPRLPASRRAL
eukprot:CAMPEP_0183356546 /NCGR_PEP_ID=MMETSP0164_2-20130417/44814_1 /TAXON_ID=221442 /ORGANISM="Coccolithus pelagicus ssp braarudi, Strain PLY182g" /LENGTH=145 /DNA_ID=CAMNT_0025529997 /DNA_START=485 /DNA_END=919 /DNA_ORIENTATION=-